MARTCNSELREGASDGTFKKVRPNTGNLDPQNTAALVAMRSDLLQDGSKGFGFTYGSVTEIPAPGDWIGR